MNSSKAITILKRYHLSIKLKDNQNGNQHKITGEVLLTITGNSFTWGANLRWANLQDADLQAANLQGANTGANTRSKLAGVNLQATTYNSKLARS